MKKYRARVHYAEITEVEAQSETEAFVVINGRRSAKRTSYDNYFDSFDDAKGFLEKYAENEIKKYEVRLSDAKNHYNKIMAL